VLLFPDHIELVELQVLTSNLVCKPCGMKND
jgi:hypothetical protein